MRTVPVLVCLASLTVLLAGPRRLTLADDATPTVPVPVATLLPTLAPPTVAPTVEAEPTWTPIVSSESSPPVATAISYPTAYSPPTALPVVPRTERRFPTATATTPAPAEPPAAVVGPTAPGSVPAPSPAQLRYDARLRWGNGIPAEVRRWAFLVVPAARKYHIDPVLVAAVMTIESGGDPLAQSPADARGLMQVLHGPWDPRDNVYEGVRMLASYLRAFSSVPLALAAYNAGPNAVTEYNGIPPYRETQDYVIIGTYLYDLFGHHHLSARRKAQFRKSVADLAKIPHQRKKAALIAQLADVTAPVAGPCHYLPQACAPQSEERSPALPDPFWPLSDTPDPLQQIGGEDIAGT